MEQTFITNSFIEIPNVWVQICNQILYMKVCHYIEKEEVKAWKNRPFSKGELSVFAVHVT